MAYQLRAAGGARTRSSGPSLRRGSWQAGGPALEGREMFLTVRSSSHCTCNVQGLEHPTGVCAMASRALRAARERPRPSGGSFQDPGLEGQGPAQLSDFLYLVTTLHTP